MRLFSTKNLVSYSKTISAKTEPQRVLIEAVYNNNNKLFRGIAIKLTINKRTFDFILCCFLIAMLLAEPFENNV